MRLSKRLSKYSDIEYSYTQNTSIAGKLIRAQAEQIWRMTVDEYIREKTGSGADGQEDT